MEKLYLGTNASTALPRARTEAVILSKALEIYDSATNGNRQRGAMKKANDM